MKLETMKTKNKLPMSQDPAHNWRTFAMQYKGETRASLELCARRSDAAPELLEALKDLLAILPYYEHKDRAKVEAARQAIAKAEGRT